MNSFIYDQLRLRTTTEAVWRSDLDLNCEYWVADILHSYWLTPKLAHVGLLL